MRAILLSATLALAMLSGRAAASHSTNTACNNRGWGPYTWGGSTYCYCMWPYGGDRCETCRPTHVLTNGQCVECVDMYSTYVDDKAGLSGAPVPFQVRLKTPGCMAAVPIIYQWPSTSYMWPNPNPWRQATAVSGYSNVVLMDMPECTDASVSPWYKLVSVYVGNVADVSNSGGYNWNKIAYVGNVRCMAPFVYPSLTTIPRVLHVHILSLNDPAAVAVGLSTIATAWALEQATELHVTYHGGPAPVVYRRGTNVRDVAVGLEVLRHTGLGTTCGFDTTHTSAGTDKVMLILGDLPEACTASQRNGYAVGLTPLVATYGYSIAWIAAHDVWQPPAFVTMIRYTHYEYTNDNAAYGQLQRFFSERRNGPRCGGALTATPANNVEMKRDTVRLNGACNVSHCCLESTAASCRASPTCGNGGCACARGDACQELPNCLWSEFTSTCSCKPEAPHAACVAATDCGTGCACTKKNSCDALDHCRWDRAAAVCGCRPGVLQQCRDDRSCAKGCKCRTRQACTNHDDLCAWNEDTGCGCRTDLESQYYLQPTDAQCSPFTSTLGSDARCALPAALSGTYEFTVRADLGTRRVNTGNPLMNMREPTWQDHSYYVYSWSNWWADGRTFIYAFKSWSWYSRATSTNRHCCSLVGIGFDMSVMGRVPGLELCWSGYYGYQQLSAPPTADSVRTLFHTAPMAVAWQCGQEPAVLPATPRAVDGEVASAGGTEVKDFDATVTSSGARTTRIGKYIAGLLASSQGATAAGYPLFRVRRALELAELVSGLPSEAKEACQEGDVPNRDARCYHTLSRKAKDVGPYLRSMGFVEVETDWDLRNSALGDIVVYPACTIGGVNYASGYIAVRHTVDAAASNHWVGEIRHTQRPLGASQNGAVDRNNGPVLYRLAETAPLPPRENEQLVPLNRWSSPLVLTNFFVTDASSNAWTTNWLAFDRNRVPAMSHYAQVAQYYPCPTTPQAPWPTAVLRTDTWWTPVSSIAQLWNMWDNRISPSTPYAKACYEWFTWDNSGPGFGVRCCYDSNYNYIPRWPSRVTTGRSSGFSESIELNAETVACMLDGTANRMADESLTPSCAKFSSRRPAPPGVFDPFATDANGRALYRWTPRRRNGGGFGDPHCATPDGLQYPCNFRGEAVWTSCGLWKVHAVGTPAGANGAATVLTEAAVRSGEDTVIIMVGAGSRASDRDFRVVLNNNNVAMSSSSTNLTVEVQNRTVTVTDVSGHRVDLLVNPTRISITVATADVCRGLTTGLMGNNDGDSTNDLRPRGSTTHLDAGLVTTNEERVYEDHVLTHLITAQSDSIFPVNNFTAGNSTYRPLFLTAAMLSSCPAACNADRGCCFDYAVGGQEFLDAYKADAARQAAANEGAIAFNANFPPTVNGPSVIQLGADNRSTTPRTLARFNATDRDNIATIECSLCTGAPAELQIVCTAGGVGSAIGTMEITGLGLPAGVFTCNFTDGRGVKAVATTRVVAYVAEETARYPEGSNQVAADEGNALPPMTLVLIAAAGVAGLVILSGLVYLCKSSSKKAKNADAVSAVESVDERVPKKAGSEGAADEDGENLE